MYTLDPHNSIVRWEGRKKIGFIERGTVQFSQGAVEVVDGAITGGSFTVDLTTLDSRDSQSHERNEKFVTHLKADDFFGVEQHPTATLDMHTVADDGTVTGDLTIRGITHEITFLPTVQVDDRRLTLTAQLSFDRSRFDIKYGSGTFFENLGDSLIEDMVTLDVTVVAMAS